MTPLSPPSLPPWIPRREGRPRHEAHRIAARRPRRPGFPVLGFLVAVLLSAASPVRPSPRAQGERPPAAEGSTPAPSRGLLLVLNKSDATATFLDPASGEVRGITGTGIGPHEVAARGGVAYVSNYGAEENGHTITVLSTKERRARRTIDLGTYGRPHGIAVHPADGNLFVTCEARQALVEVDPRRGTIVESWETGKQVSHMVVLDPLRDRAYVTSIGSGTCTAIDLEKGSLHHVATGAGAEGLDLAPDGREVWVANREADTVTVLDAATLERIADLSTARFPIRVRFTPDGARVLVSCAVAGVVLVFDARTREEIGRVETGGEPIGILVEPSGRRAFVAKTRQDEVDVVNLEDLSIERVLPTGHTPDGMAWVEDGETRIRPPDEAPGPSGRSGRSPASARGAGERR